MTKEEAIMVLKAWIERDKKMEYVDRLENIEIYNMAIEALEQESSEDYTVIKKLSKKYYVEDAYGYTDEDIVNKVNEIIDAVNESSSITPQPKIGHWINLEETKYKGQVLPFWSRYECSKCGGHGEGTFNYCPNCGADMRESEVKANADSD